MADKATANYELLKHAETDREIFLGIFTDRFDQVPRFDQHLVGIVVKRRVFEQLAGAAFSGFQPVRDSGELVDDIYELLRELFILQQFSSRSTARIEIGD